MRLGRSEAGTRAVHGRAERRKQAGPGRIAARMQHGCNVDAHKRRHCVHLDGYKTHMACGLLFFFFFCFRRRPEKMKILENMGAGVPGEGPRGSGSIAYIYLRDRLPRPTPGESEKSVCEMNRRGGERMAENGKLTQQEKEEILLTYIESRFDAEKYKKPVTQQELARQYGVDQSTISRVISSSDEIEALNRRMRVDTLLSQAMAQRAAPKVMAEMIKDALKPRKDKLRYLNQNAARDVLDRAGVRAVKEDRQELVLSFASGEAVRPRMPEREEDEA